jgi:hypothetical protein
MEYDLSYTKKGYKSFVIKHYVDVTERGLAADRESFSGKWYAFTSLANSQHTELRAQSRYLIDTLHDTKCDLKIANWRLDG